MILWISDVKNSVRARQLAKQTGCMPGKPCLAACCMIPAVCSCCGALRRHVKSVSQSYKLTQQNQDGIPERGSIILFPMFDRILSETQVVLSWTSSDTAQFPSEREPHGSFSGCFAWTPGSRPGYPTSSCFHTPRRINKFEATNGLVSEGVWNHSKIDHWSTMIGMNVQRLPSKVAQFETSLTSQFCWRCPDL